MTTVAFLVNSDFSSAMAQRARAFATYLQGPYDIRILYRSRRKVWSISRLLAALLRRRPEVCYVFDMAYSGVLAALLARRLTGCRVVIDTGDAITALAASMGRSPLGLWLTRRLEAVSLAGADRIVVRGTYHQEWLSERGVRAEVIPDGVESSLIGAPDAGDLRKEYGLENVLTVGLVGSVVWNPRLQTCYGWDLIELIRLLKDRPVKGVLIGDGSGLSILKARASEYGVADRVLFLGRVPYEELPRRLGLIDVCLSTQTDDLAGRVRTTGKLPLYLATGRYILASRVGEAARVLDEDMLVEFEGDDDPAYPRKLAGRILRLLDDPRLLDRRLRGFALARERFDYAVLARKMAEVIDDAANRSRRSAGPRPALQRR